MAKVEIPMTDEQKAAMKYAAEKENLKLATWARSKLLTLAQEALPMKLGQ